MARIDSFFKFMKEQNASDLHLSTGNPPMLRIHGELVRVDMPALENDDLKALVYEMRFDEVSAAYADFGEFYIGIQLPLDELFRRLQL